MPITFQKRQKELKRRAKQLAKEERRAQKKLAKRAENEPPPQDESAPLQPESQN